MNSNSSYRNPEPVPPVSQLAVMPFLAGIDGVLKSDGAGLRMTLHRAMSREGRGYLQQLCNYVGPKEEIRRSGVGRMFPANHGIMGLAYEHRAISRTKYFSTKQELLQALQEDKKKTRDKDPIVQMSWLAIPFLGPSDEPVLIFFADSVEYNFFAYDDRVQTVAKMCRGFCELIDTFEDDKPFSGLRNFPLRPGKMVRGPETLYTSVQEELTNIEIPRFRTLRSFNYEMSLA